MTDEACRGFFKRGDMQREFEEAAFQLKKGEVSGIVETASGVHLIQRFALLPWGGSTGKLTARHIRLE